MTLQHQRITVFTVSSVVVAVAACNLLVSIFSRGFVWYNIIDVIVLLPSLLAAEKLLRLFIRRAKRREYMSSRAHRESINNGYVYSKK